MIEIKIKHQIYTSSGKKNLEINEQIQEGSIVHVSGDSGIGKTTFFKILSGLISPDYGWIKWSDNILLDTSRQIFLSPQKRNISILFQNYALFPNMTVKQNIAFAQKEKNEEIVDYFLEVFNLKKMEKILPSKLSGGQQQRVALARTLVQKSDIVLLDEPLSAIDSEMRKKILIEIVKFQEATKATFFVISHDEDFKFISNKKLAIS